MHGHASIADNLSPAVWNVTQEEIRICNTCMFTLFHTCVQQRQRTSSRTCSLGTWERDIRHNGRTDTHPELCRPWLQLLPDAWTQSILTRSAQKHTHTRYARTYTCLPYTHTHKHMPKPTCAHTHRCTQTHAQTHANVHAFTHTCHHVS